MTANYRHGICSKDDLVVTGGILNVTAVEDCLRGRDCVKIADGTFSLVAGGDGIKSNKDTEATQAAPSQSMRATTRCRRKPISASRAERSA